MPIKLIAVDIDGTLLPTVTAPTDRLEISARNRRALREAQASGIKIVVATGRRQAYAAPLIDPIGLSPETGMITSNGSITRTLSGRRIDRFFLAVETARALCPALRQFGGATVFTFDREGPGQLVVESIPRLHERIDAWLEANRPWIAEITPLENAFDSNEAPVQGMVCGTIAGMQQAEQWLQASGFAGKIETHRTEYPVRDLSILDILPPNCSKGIALRKLAAGEGILPEEIMAIGDNFNDLEMLELAGQPVVMANAADELLALAKTRGWQIAPTNDDDGVAQAIESVLEAAAVQ